MAEERKKLILIDGNALLYRAFYALPPLHTSEGIPTGGVYGFTRILLKLLREEKPDYMACAFDKGKETFRHKKWEDYKATRPKTPPELNQQAPWLKKILQGFHIPVFEDEEYEADDILATIARRAEKEGLHVDIFTGDKDILQIVAPHVHIVRFKKGISQTEKFDADKVKQEYGVPPEQISDYLALMGDASDNIPGVRGIGPVTARKLIEECGNLDAILANPERVPSKHAKKIRENIETVKLSKNLATVITEVPLDVDFDELKIKTPDEKELFLLFQKLEFKEFVRNLNSCLPDSSGLDEQNRVEENCEKITSISRLRKVLSSFPDVPLIIHLQSTKDEESLFDTRVWEIAFSPLKGDSVFELPLGENPKENLLFQELTGILTSEKVKKVGHDLKDTIITLKEWGTDLRGVEFDTGIAAYLLNSSSVGYSLDEIYGFYLGKARENFHSVSGRVSAIKKLYPALKEQIKDTGMRKLFFEVEMPLIQVLADMQVRGIKVDSGVLEGFLQEVRDRRGEIQEEIWEEAGEEFNINSSQQLGHILFEKLHLPVVKRTKTGYSTDEEVIRTLCNIRPSLSKILDYRCLSKLESTYIKPLLNMVDPETGRIHTEFSQITASTGRLASSRPNLQNIPIREKLGQRIRRAFVADRGHLFISADYSQIELRILAHLSGDENLISSFLRGDDIHRETAAEIFDCLPLEVTPQMRRKAKVVNFGIVYGISAFGLARDLEISEKEAEQFIERYFSRYPGVKNYIEGVLEKAEKRGYVTTMMGRRRYLPQINARNRRQREFARRIAINSPIQGGAADLIKLAMVNLDRRLRKENLPAWMLLQIHDELLLEVVEEKVDEVRKVVKEEMEGAMKLSVPIIVDTKVGRSWAEI